MIEITNEQIFLTVVEAGSFKGAAESLAMDPSLISRRVASLEKRLNVKLMERSTKQSTPTEQGQRYYQGLKTLFEEKQVLESIVCGSANVPTGHLKVAAPHDFGVEFVMQVLECMADHYPKLTVELVLGSQYENLQTQGIDVAVRIGELPDSSLICRRIGNVPRVLVASKGYIARYGEPTTVAQLDNHHFIFYAKSHMNEPIKIGNQSIVLKGKFVANSVSAIRQMVMNDQGMHIGPIWAFKKEIMQGNLVKVLPQERFTSSPLHALYVSRAYVPAKVRVFIDALIEKYGSGEFD